jgi:hypothetical protein
LDVHEIETFLNDGNDSDIDDDFPRIVPSEQIDFTVDVVQAFLSWSIRLQQRTGMTTTSTVIRWSFQGACVPDTYVIAEQMQIAAGKEQLGYVLAGPVSIRWIGSIDENEFYWSWLPSSTVPTLL